jgi:hypothetical protein
MKPLKFEKVMQADSGCRELRADLLGSIGVSFRAQAREGRYDQGRSD